MMIFASFFSPYDSWCRNGRLEQKRRSVDPHDCERGVEPKTQVRRKSRQGAAVRAEPSKCGAEMKIVGFIERENDGLIRSLLKQAGLWKDFVPRAPPKVSDEPPAENIPCVAEPAEYVLDAEYFNSIC